MVKRVILVFSLFLFFIQVLSCTNTPPTPTKTATTKLTTKTANTKITTKTDTTKLNAKTATTQITTKTDTTKLTTAEPRPFGLILGKTTKEEAISILKKNGGEITKSGYRIIKGDISNPNVEGIDFTGLPIKDLTNARFWFFHKILFQIVYTFPLSMSKDEFYVMYKELASKYGKPLEYVKPWLANGLAVWKFGNVEVKLEAPWVSWGMYVTYTYLPLYEKAQQSDKEVFTKETSKPQIGL